MKIHELDKLIKSVCPIHGINSDGAISFKDEATEPERAAASALMATHIVDLSLAPEIIVSPRQLRHALTRTSLRASVESSVASGDQDLKDWWEFATEFQRNHPMVIAMAQGLGVSDSVLDSLFELAATL